MHVTCMVTQQAITIIKAELFFGNLPHSLPRSKDKTACNYFKHLTVNILQNYDIPIMGFVSH